MKSKVRANKSKVLFILIGIIILAGSLLGWYVLYRQSTSPSNHAEEVGQSIENGLIRAGGVQKTSGGNSGYGSDNTTPYFDTTYEVPLDKEKTIALVNKITEANGYKLRHASPGDRGHLGAVGDAYIDNWYFDNTSKNSTFHDLKDGPIKIAFEIGNKDHQEDPGHTPVRINIQLPDTKR